MRFKVSLSSTISPLPLRGGLPEQCTVHVKGEDQFVAYQVGFRRRSSTMAMQWRSSILIGISGCLAALNSEPAFPWPY